MRDSGAGGAVLVVEDEDPIAALEQAYLEREGFRVERAASGSAALTAARHCDFRLILLDVRLPDLDGFEVCRRLRAAGDTTPVLFVTARDERPDRVQGLDLGADDYITKPFSPRELIARLHAVLRRSPLVPDPLLRHGRLALDPTRRLVLLAGEPVPLTATEFDLLAHLLRFPAQVFSRSQLLAGVWRSEGSGDRTVDVHVAQLRAKLGQDCPIRTVRGLGYAGIREP